jgi:hypothetical protein
MTRKRDLPGIAGLKALVEKGAPKELVLAVIDAEAAAQEAREAERKRKQNIKKQRQRARRAGGPPLSPGQRGTTGDTWDKQTENADSSSPAGASDAWPDGGTFPQSPSSMVSPITPSSGSSDGGDGSARAASNKQIDERPPPSSPQSPQSTAEASSQAHLLASEIMAIAGIDAAEKPDGWDYAAYVVEHWLNRGAGPALIRLAVGRVTRWRNRRGKEPPATPNYYHKAVMRELAAAKNATGQGEIVFLDAREGGDGGANRQSRAADRRGAGVLDFNTLAAELERGGDPKPPGSRSSGNR